MKSTFTAKIVCNKKVAGGYRNMKLLAPLASRRAVPGQFVSLKTTEFLRRPMSLHRINPPYLEILYKVRGKGTEYLKSLKKGALLDILGPLGHGFVERLDFETAILVGGGYGISPLKALFDLLKKNKKRIITIAGAKTAGLIFKDGFSGVKVVTEDGTAGVEGVVTGVLAETCCGLKGRAMIFACGPDSMLKAVGEVAKAHKVPCRVSMENMMGCGVGVCLSCVCKTTYGQKRVCADGPVFNYEEIKWK